MKLPAAKPDPILSAPLERRLVLRAALTVAGLSVFSERRVLAASGPELIVIVHPENPATSIERELLANLFLKKTLRWDDGEPARPVDLRADSPVRRIFSETILRRSVAAVRHYWQERIFSGRDLPPPELDPEQAAMRFVAKYRGAVGYISPGVKLVDVKALPVR